ncbi:LysR family transcriptional regulator [Xenorhabdus sp. Vera]|uniref:LysR family transcriptional regulator n=1 Tax=Xenorhabdus koppenhoeferi TaxID=351659 RepID=UPI0019911662|nr:LysR family transcriptional regulator [Xenorhabdus sp. Vera]MBD2810864.1 LysR family transcriptional regulator [Xenorhabdus sp. Vera]
MRKIPPLNALKIFDITARYKSFSSAASENHMTKGAISQQIKILENWFGFELFNRSANGIELTDNGSKLMKTCNLAFSVIEKQCEDLRKKSHTHNEIIIGCSSSLLSYWFLPKLYSFFSTDKQFVLNYNSQASFQSIINGEVDFFISGEKISNYNFVDCELLYKDEIGLVCSVEYRTKIFNNDIRDITLLRSQSRYSAWDEWSYLSNIILNVSDEIIFDKLSLALDAVKLNLGVTIAPKFVVENDINKGFLHAPFGFLNCSSGTYLYTRNNLSNDKKIIIDKIINKVKS